MGSASSRPRVDDNKSAAADHLIAADKNKIIITAIPHEHNHTVIRLVTPIDPWTKKIIVTTEKDFGIALTCSDFSGKCFEESDVNNFERNIYEEFDCGEPKIVALQFQRANLFALRRDCGTMELPEKYFGHTVTFYWPDDAPADYFTSFKKAAVNGATAAESIMTSVKQGADLNNQLATR